MDMQIRQTMELKQQLVMTPRMQQSIRLLQVPAVELRQEVKAEMTANPLLEEAPQEDVEPEVSEEIEKEREAEMEKWEEYFESHFQDSLDTASYRGSYEEREEFERTPVEVPSLHDHLLEQLRLKSLTDEEMEVGEYLIQCLDDTGFLSCSLLGEWDEARGVRIEHEEHWGLDEDGFPTCVIDDSAEKLGVPAEEVARVLKEVVQTLEPAGIGARDLRECLLIQLRQKGEEGSVAWRIVKDHMPELERRKYQKISRALRVPMEEVKRAVSLIATLEPRPGQKYSAEGARSVIPDLIVERVNDEYVVTPNDRDIPRLQISPVYRKLMRNGSKETKEYVVEKLNSANWLIRAIEQRRQTMLKVMNHIVKVQRDFFDRGIAYMKPLTLLEVADAIGMHESTVSRVTNGKYVQTPRGVFELKFFFGSSLSGRNGEDVASKAVKDKILNLIRNEDPEHPYSDQQIVDILSRDGLKIARRTVAKYRDQLKILPARMRKRV